MSANPNTELIKSALVVAHSERSLEKGVIFHSDQGSPIYQSRISRPAQRTRCDRCKSFGEFIRKLSTVPKRSSFSGSFFQLSVKPGSVQFAMMTETDFAKLVTTSS
jgi:hypothetical protein